MEIEAAIEAIGNGAEVAFGVPAEAKGVAGLAGAGFQVTEDRVHPVEDGQVLKA